MAMPLLAAACVCFSAIALPPKAQESLAYVVFQGEIVAVDMARRQVVKRLDFIDHLKPARDATIQEKGRFLSLVGQTPDLQWGVLEVSIPDLVLRKSAKLDRMPFGVLSGRPEGPLAVDDAHMIVLSFVHEPEDYLARRSIEVVDASSLRTLSRLVIRPTSDESPSEEISQWATTPDGKELIVVTTGGLKEQCFMRFYSLPSLKPTGVVKLLKIWDDVPIKLLIP